MFFLFSKLVSLPIREYKSICFERNGLLRSGVEAAILLNDIDKKLRLL